MFLPKNRHENVHTIHMRNMPTRAANIYSFIRGRYHNVKYKNSPYYKGLLPVETRRCNTMIEFKKCLDRFYSN